MTVQGPLDGIRVIEVGTLISGPFAGRLLGDMGADVVKIEPPGAGDPMRNWGQGDEKVQWEVIARNKRSVTCNLRVPEGQALAKRLIAEADVLIENFKVGGLKRFGLDYESLAAGNPRLVYARQTGWGQYGPLAHTAGNDINHIAISGALHAIGRASEAPA
mgnify:CR=1 FL=1